jgi:hypothetical protein
MRCVLMAGCLFSGVMKPVSIEAALNRRPFRPFEVRVDGEVVCVGHPEQALLAENKSTLIIVDPQDHVHILDVDQISKIRLLPRGMGTRQRSGSGGGN